MTEYQAKVIKFQSAAERRPKAELESPQPFFETDVRGPENVWQREINRAYDLGLDKLRPEHVDSLAPDDQAVVAVATHSLLLGLQKRSQLLMASGGYNHPAFVHYRLNSKVEADSYVATMQALYFDLMRNPTVLQLETTYLDLCGDQSSKTVTGTAWRYAEPARQLKRIQVVDDVVELSWSSE